MAQKTETGMNRRFESGTRPAWVSGVLAGLLGGAAMGVVFSVVVPPVIENAIPALVGTTGGVAGWIVHMAISAIFGVAFAALLTSTRVGRYATGRVGPVGLGIAFGIVVWATAAAFVMPVWLGAVGFPGPSLPNFDTMSLVAHVVYGAVLGVVYPYV